MTKPLIGAVNGVAITGGFEVALACNFLIASEKAAFADAHARMGIMLGWGLTVLLREAVGFRRAQQLSTTGNFLDAQTALSWGLVNHVIPHDELVPFTQKLAADIASNDQVAVRRMLSTYARVRWSTEKKPGRSKVGSPASGSRRATARRRPRGTPQSGLRTGPLPGLTNFRVHR